MFNVGISELFVFLIIALIILGPEKLPQAIRFIGQWYAKSKRFVGNIQNDIDRELRLSELKAQMDQEIEKIRALEKKLNYQSMNLEKKMISTTQLTFTKKSFSPIQKIYYGYHPNYPFIASSINTPPKLKIAV